MKTRKPLPPPSEIDNLPKDGGEEFNRLVFSSSPYLRQHARNPVNWYPWGDEAFDKARKEHKPVFLSVGYSSCHWCHVMEHESFEHEDVAAVLNEKFVSVKLDREERPDVDAVYMQATQLMTGRGGWPNSVFLDSNRIPFFAGTYWPREDRGPNAGFLSLLGALSDAWETDQASIQRQTSRMIEALQRMRFDGSDQTQNGWNSNAFETVLHDVEADFDHLYGGFGGAPKFPPHSVLALLLFEQAQRPNAIQLNLITNTLNAIAKGGIRDHVGGGFHRYAVDRKWFLPHFEKMLYDNGQLARLFALAFAMTKDPHYERVLRELCDWVMRQMTSQDGTFYSAYDADSEGEEGLYYIWRLAELIELLGEDRAEALAEAYEATEAGNYFEEASREATGANILYLQDLASGQAEGLRDSLRDLRAFRESRRVPPMLDDKVITSWNGLMIGGLAQAGRVLDDSRYVAAAAKAASTLLAEHRRRDGRLIRTRRDGVGNLDGCLDDYVFLADGLLDLYDATREERWKREALALMRVVEEEFSDGVGAYYFAKKEMSTELPVRQRDPFDNATPSGIGIAAQVWVRLGEREKAEGVLHAFAAILENVPRACLSLVHAQQMLKDGARPAAGVGWSHRQAEFLIEVDTLEVRHGTNALQLTLRLAENWHVTANPASLHYLIPFSVRVEGEGVTLEEPSYPEGEPLVMEGVADNVQVYSGEVELRLMLRVQDFARQAALHIELQTCDTQSCLPPSRWKLPLVLK